MEDSEARTVIQNNIRLFTYFATAVYKNNTYDLFQELCLLFMQNYKKWDRKYALATFLSFLIKNAHKNVSKFQKWFDHNHTGYGVIFDKPIMTEPFPDGELIKHIINTKLSIKQRVCIIEIYYNKRILDDVANIFKCSRQNASLIRIAAEERLKPLLEEEYVSLNPCPNSYETDLQSTGRKLERYNRKSD